MFFNQETIIIPFSYQKYNLKSDLDLFNSIKKSFWFFYSYFFISLFLIYQYKLIKFLISLESNLDFSKKKSNYDDLLIGYHKSNKILVNAQGQFQNFLITGSIGSGKTSSSIYPFTNQYFNMLKYEQIGFLILDVKGNFIDYINTLSKKYGIKDIIEISLKSEYTYNPLDKPNLKSQVLANRLRIILELFSNNADDSYWLEKAEITISHAISLIRLYNNYYVNFLELHKIIFESSYFDKKIEYLKKKFLKNELTDEQIFDFHCAYSYFANEFWQLDPRTSNIIKSEISRITNVFINDYEIIKTFCPKKENITFSGFKDIILNGGIVVFNLNIAKYKNLSKILAAYLKLDFQTEVLENISISTIKKVFICDEYDKYATSSDGEFFSLSREAKCINIISTQSYSSIKQSVKDETSLNIIIQNLVNKIWFRQDDNYTIEQSQKLLGQEYKKLSQRSISENSNNTKYNYFTKRFTQLNSNISESINETFQKDYIYDSNYFSQNIETFSALCFLSNGTHMEKSLKVDMIPYFKGGKNN